MLMLKAWFLFLLVCQQVLQISTSELCVLVELPLAAAAATKSIRAVRRTWATNGTAVYFAAPRNLPPWFASGQRVAQGILLWRKWARRLSKECTWVMKVPAGTYVNIPSVLSRLRCLTRSPDLEYLGTPARFSSGDYELNIAVAQAGIILRSSLLVRLSQIFSSCAKYEAMSTWQEDVFLGFCLYMSGTVLHTWVDSTEEVFYETAESVIRFDYETNDKENHAGTHARFVTYFDGIRLSMAQCAMLVSGLSHAELDDIHTMVEKSRRWFRQVACIPSGLGYGEFVVMSSANHASGDSDPSFSPSVVDSLRECVLNEAVAVLQAGPQVNALSVFNSGVSLREEWRHPMSSYGKASSHLQAKRHDLCIFVPFTSSSEKYLIDAKAVLRTWADPERLPAGVGVFFVGLGQVFATEAMHLMLPGDADLGYLYSGLRLLYLWRYLSVHHAGACRWFAKADADTYVNVGALNARLRTYFDDTKPFYLGSVKAMHSLEPERQVSFAHNVAVLSQGLLKLASTWFEACLDDLLFRRFGRGVEDVELANCLYEQGRIEPKMVGAPVEVLSSGAAETRFDFENATDRARREMCTLFRHPVHRDAMLELATRLNHSASSTPCEWPEQHDDSGNFRRAYLARNGSGETSCWSGGFTWSKCCHADYGPFGNSLCWDDAYNYQKCC
eukprot:TRINITY_DN49983_c0_g1_i1.p1 TRINITY_DN49983_c0_g1~~TRINITY_DN49983_c0_g1_i1.p1  ORF type:complete len:672 (-),score=58.12 TRINITY_DN49983_c0_g1_i1:17-2032(-)